MCVDDAPTWMVRNTSPVSALYARTTFSTASTVNAYSVFYLTFSLILIAERSLTSRVDQEGTDEAAVQRAERVGQSPTPPFADSDRNRFWNEPTLPVDPLE